MTRRFGRGPGLLLVTAGLALLASPARAQGEGAPAPGPAPMYPPGGGAAPTSGGPSNASDESQDSGLGLEWVYLNADVGYSYVNMASFSASQLGLEQTAGSGLDWGVGAGVRLLFLSAGVRVRNALLDNPGSLWTLDLEAALHMRIWHIDPYLGVRGGYAFVGSFSSNSVTSATGMTQPNVDVHGFDVGPTLGLDVYFTSLVSVGVEGQAQFLFLQRPKAALPPDLQQAMAVAAMNGQTVMLTPEEQQLYNNSGSSVGFGGVATVHLGIHF